MEGQIKKNTIEKTEKRRDSFSIIYEILGVINEEKPAKKTRIMYKSHLSFTQLNQYLSLLTETGLIRNVNKTRYLRTKLGTEIYNQIYSTFQKLREVGIYP